MDKKAQQRVLKSILLREVSNLCRHIDRRWNEPIVETLQAIRETESHAVFFGGTLRSLLVSRRFYGRPGRPRDVDIVVAGTTLQTLKERFGELVMRETRFGGLHIHRKNWQFDLWPLHRTWAFVNDNVHNPGFAALPFTTFFNLEAIAVDVWPMSGRARRIYSGDDQFFDGILEKTLEINREENPFPTLCVVRSLVMAAALDFAIGPKLARYIVREGTGIQRDELEDVQREHYGAVRRHGKTLKEWINRIAECHSRDENASVRLSLQRQLRLWPEDDASPCVHVRVLTEQP